MPFLFSKRVSRFGVISDPDFLILARGIKMSLQDFLLYALKRTTVDENIIVTIKTQNNFCYALKIIFFQYCDSNIELFSITPHLVIALPTLRQQKLSLLITLLQFLYEFFRLVHGFFSVLLPIQLLLIQLLRQQQLSLFYAFKGVSVK